MIDGVGCTSQILKRNWHRKPSWWNIDLVIPDHSPRFSDACKSLYRMMPLRNDQIRVSISGWLEQNMQKKYRLTQWSVELQNYDDATLLILALA